jgi:hypothetical protein
MAIHWSALGLFVDPGVSPSPLWIRVAGLTPRAGYDWVASSMSSSQRHSDLPHPRGGRPHPWLVWVALHTPRHSNGSALGRLFFPLFGHHSLAAAFTVALLTSQRYVFLFGLHSLPLSLLATTRVSRSPPTLLLPPVIIPLVPVGFDGSMRSPGFVVKPMLHLTGV